MKVQRIDVECKGIAAVPFMVSSAQSRRAPTLRQGSPGGIEAFAR